MLHIYIYIYMYEATVEAQRFSLVTRWCGPRGRTKSRARQETVGRGVDMGRGEPDNDDGDSALSLSSSLIRVCFYVTCIYCVTVFHVPLLARRVASRRRSIWKHGTGTRASNFQTHVGAELGCDSRIRDSHFEVLSLIF